MAAPNDAFEEPHPRNPVDTASEAHRHACEVRWLVALPTHAARADYLERVTDRRGTAAADALRRDAWAVLNPAPPLGRSAHADGNNEQRTKVAGPSRDVA